MSGGQSSIFGGEPPVYYQTYQQQPQGLLSPEEKKNITIAIVALTGALTMVLLGGLEMAHKFVAQHYGCWAEFRYSRQGLIIALALAAFAGFLFSAPGAVYIAGRIDQRQNGIISIAGPLTNVAVAVAAIPILLMFSGTIIASGFYTVIFFNAILAIFNMIPVMPLDGAKVLKWNPAIYVISLVGMGALMYYVWVYL